jgi:Holliday junction DNA helicase RuvB
VAGSGAIDAASADAALLRLEVDAAGLDAMDRRYLLCLADHYGGGPVGVETLAAALSEQRDALEEVIEPFLMQQGFVMRTPRGRMLADNGWRHLRREPPRNPARQMDLLGEIEGPEAEG